MITILSDGVPAVCISVAISAFFSCFMAMSLYNIFRHCEVYGSKVILMSSFSAVMLTLSGFIHYRAVTCMSVFETGLAVMPLLSGMKRQRNWKQIYPLSYIVLFMSLIMCIMRFVFPGHSGLLDSFVFIIPLTVILIGIVLPQIDFFRTSFDRYRVAGAFTPRKSIYSDLAVIYYGSLYSAIIVSCLAMNFSSAVCRLILFFALLTVMLVYMLSCLHISTGAIILFNSRKDAEFKKMIRTGRMNVKNECGSDHVYRTIYDRLLLFFENEKPYLDSNISIESVASRIYCNKLYLSRAISLYSGRNFCQYVNYFRIKHAVNLFDADHIMRMSDWAEQAGFRNVTSFNMAFRLYMNDTPGEWCRKRKGAEIEAKKSGQTSGHDAI